MEPTDVLIKDLTEVVSLTNSIAVWRSKGLKTTGGGHDGWKETIDALDRDGARSDPSPRSEYLRMESRCRTLEHGWNTPFLTADANRENYQSTGCVYVFRTFPLNRADLSA